MAKGTKKKDEKEERPGDAPDLSYTAVRNQLGDVGDEIRRVTDKDDILPEDEKYLTELEDKFVTLNEQRKGMEREALRSRVDAVTGRPATVEHGHTTKDLDDDPFGEPQSTEDRKFSDPWDLEAVRMFGDVAGELRSRAYSAIESMPGTNDKRREAMTGIIERWDNQSGDLAKQLLATSSPAYMRAFSKAAKDQESEFTAEEAAAASNSRAMSLTDTAGGFMIPFQLDPTVINTSDGSLNQIRQAARQVIATGDVWNGISAGETAWSWDAEAAEVSDDASTFAQPTVGVHKAAGFIPISIEAAQDEANVAAEVSRLLADGKATLEAAAFATGSGSGRPFGIITALNTIAGSIVTAATSTLFGAVDVYAVDGALPAKHRARASWLANRAIYNEVRQLDTAGGSQLWERIGSDVPAELLGRPAFESEDMDGVISVATTDDYILVYGDFDNYVIADRVGMTVEFIPHLFHTTSNRPSGQRGWYAHYRVGADVVNNGAFRLLHNP